MRMTKAFLETKLVALEAANDALRAEVAKLRASNFEYQAAFAADVRDRSSIVNMRETLARCRQLNEAGVPCKVRSGRIYHLRTGAIIP